MLVLSPNRTSRTQAAWLTALSCWVIMAGCGVTAGSPVGVSTVTPSSAISSAEPADMPIESLSASASGSASALASASASSSSQRNPNACAPPDEGWGNYEGFQQLGKYRLALPKVEKAPADGFDVIIHFHMGDAIRRTVVQTAFPAVYLSFDAGEGSNKYKKSFLDNHAFRDLRASLEGRCRNNGARRRSNESFCPRGAPGSARFDHHPQGVS
ncbi:MAG: hypothetical protein U0165_04735 [Polyangiaceae bacterium]